MILVPVMCVANPYHYEMYKQQEILEQGKEQDKKSKKDHYDYGDLFDPKKVIRFAVPFRFEINANTSVVEAAFDVTWDPFEPFTKSAGIGILYDVDEYSVFYCDFSLGRRDFLGAEGLTFKMGFDGLFGTIETSTEETSTGENGTEVTTKKKDYDLGALGLTLSFEVDIPEESADYYCFIPLGLELSGKLSFAPGPICFMDAEQYMLMQMALGFHIIEMKNARGTLLLGYRQLQIDFADSDRNVSDGSVYLGFKFKF